MLELKLRLSSEARKKITMMDKAVIHAADKSIKDSAFVIQGEAKRTIQKGTRTGRLYKRGKRKFHQASAPGEPPKSDLSGLVNSIRINNHFLTAEIGSDLIYASYLEEGTQHMEARPWLSPSLQSVKQKITDHFEKSIQKALNK